MSAALPRCGDHVHHAPTGEDWVVAWCDGTALAPAGWPDSIARMADCTVTRRCTDAEHRAAVAEWLRALVAGPTCARANAVRRLYTTLPFGTPQDEDAVTQWLCAAALRARAGEGA